VVRGLELGADNYITKPFTFKEVEARIRAILRRTTAKSITADVEMLEKGDVRLDGGMRSVTVAGDLKELTRTEFHLLHYLMLHADRPVSKEDLLQLVWGYDATETSANIVELAIRRLRKKIETDPSMPERLVTVRGVGYIFIPKLANNWGINQPESTPNHRGPTPETWVNVALQAEEAPEIV
jgi:DNA-binding response OmpR family regulator